MFTEAIAFLVAVVWQTAAAAATPQASYAHFLLGTEPIRVLKEEIIALRNSPTGFPKPEQITLRGPHEVGPVTLTRPWVDLLLSHLRAVHGSCAGSTKTNGEYVDVPIDSRILSDYMGRNAAGYEIYWVIAERGICGEHFLDAKPFAQYRLYFCGRRSNEIICVRDLLKSGYAAHFTVKSSDLARLEAADAAVSAYLTRVVVSDTASRHSSSPTG